MSTLGELHRVIGGQLAMGGKLDAPSTALLGPVQSDSRKIEPGDVFWASAGRTTPAKTF